ncbi:MAG: UvrD/REP helicase [Puniceicoccaceae bacterium 5H]|nr:MAG: UvrD/REP helicase [Puniceicoccaceae bacterium 5H]
MQLADQLSRDRFVAEHDRNFSVLAPAGVGKTTSIVNRIVSLAEYAAAQGESLRSLVVVTYTRAAADEMYQRAKYALVERGAGPRALGELGQAFFGTIHSFCLRLIQLHGWRLNLPAQLDMQAQDDEIWEAFRREVSGVLDPAPERWRTGLAALGAVPLTFKLARELNPETLALTPDPEAALARLGPPPEVNLQAVRAAGGRGKKETQEAYKRQLQQWQARWEALLENRERPPEEAPSLPLPEVSSGGKEIVGAAFEACAPLQQWLENAIFPLAVLLARRYQNFKLQRGGATFDDAIALAFELVRHPESVRDIRRQGFQVLLDEAQDTDPLQFRILTEIARPVNAPEMWADGANDGPVPGRFCMVGDPQQSIYSERADLGFYRALHQRLLDFPGGEELRFQVTMRCQQAVVDTLNTLLPAVLTGGEGPQSQVPYIPLEARPDATPGQVVRLALPDPEDAKPDLDRAYANALLDQVLAFDLEAWRARSWSQVALLCPRNDWLTPLARELRHRDVPVQLLTTRLLRRDQAAWAWAVAVLEVAANPENAFECYGVLREVLGFSDDALATYARHFRRDARWPAVHPFSLLAPLPWVDHPVGQALFALRRLWESSAELPLYLRVRAWFDGLQLGERLATLPEVKAEEVGAVLQAILRQAAEAEEQRLTLPEWVAELRRWVELAAVEAGEEMTACNLLTCHKAKGLGWDAVVLPYFFRPVGFVDPAFPRVQAGERGLEVALSSHWQPEHWKEEKNRRRARELERLLYVACTRARQTLVFVDDQAWMKKTDRSLGEMLRVDTGGQNRTHWEGLPQRLTPDAGETEQAPEPEPEPELAPVALDLTAAREGAKASWRRTLPSSLARHAAPEEHLREQRLANDFEQETLQSPHDPTAYGNWWHETMEHTPWEDAPEAWQAHWQAALERAPDRERAQQELDGLANSDFARQLAARERTVRCEVPFLDPAENGLAMEGIIDWLGRLQEPEELWLVDWKTDLALPGQTMAASLEQRYGPQVRAYLAGLQRLQLPTIRGFLYSTREAVLVKLA